MDSNPPTPDFPPARRLWTPVMGARVVAALVAAGCVFYLVTHPFPSAAHSRAYKYVQTEKNVILEDDIAVGLYGAAAFGLVIAIALCLTAGLWAVRMGAGSFEKPKSPKWFWPTVIVAAVLSLWLRAPLAAGSLWWDELWNLKHATVGYFKADPSKEDGYRFLQRDWEHALWNYRKPTNHPPYSVLSKATLDGWRRGAGEEDGAFNEVAARLPALAAGTLALLGAARLLRAWGMPLAGVLCAFILALHPWVVRYGVDARGYSFILLLVVAGMASVWAALRTLKWRWWILFAIVQWLLVWTLPIGVFYAAGFAAAAVAGAFLPGNRPLRSLILARIVAMNAFAAIAFAFTFAPNLLQMRRWGTINDFQMLDARVLGDTLSALFSGMPWSGNEDFPGLGYLLESRPVLTLLAFFAIGFGLLFGVVRLCLRRDDRMPAALVAGMIAAALAAIFFHIALDLHFYPRYLIYLLPVLSIVTAAGLTATGRLGKGNFRMIGWATAAITIVMAASWIVITSPQRELLRTRSYSAFREVANYRKHEDNENRLLVCYGLGGRMLPLYARDALHANNRKELNDYMNAAKADGKKLVLVYAYREFNQGHPDLGPGFEIIDDPKQFTETASLPGIEPLFEFRVLEIARQP